MHHLIISDPYSVQNVPKMIYNTNTLSNSHFSQFVKHILDPQGFLGLQPVEFPKILNFFLRHFHDSMLQKTGIPQFLLTLPKFPPLTPISTASKLLDSLKLN